MEHFFIECVSFNTVLFYHNLCRKNVLMSPKVNALFSKVVMGSSTEKVFTFFPHIIGSISRFTGDHWKGSEGQPGRHVVCYIYKAAILVVSWSGSSVSNILPPFIK